MRPFLSALAAFVVVSIGYAASGSTHDDSKKPHAKTQAPRQGTHVNRSDRAVPTTPTLKEATHVKASEPADLEPKAPASGNGCASGKREPYPVKRSPAAKAEFMHNTGYPNGRHGYFIDYFVPLECGG